MMLPCQKAANVNDTNVYFHDNVLWRFLIKDVQKIKMIYYHKSCMCFLLYITISFV